MLRRFLSPKRRHFVRSQELLCVDASEEIDKRGHGAGPAGLMACADPSAIVAVEILIEENAVLPERIVLEFLVAAEYRSPSVLVAHKDPDQPLSNLARPLEQVHPVARAGGTLHFKVVPVVEIERE